MEVYDTEEITAAGEDGESSLMESNVRECWEGYWWLVIGIGDVEDDKTSSGFEDTVVGGLNEEYT